MFLLSYSYIGTLVLCCKNKKLFHLHVPFKKTSGERPASAKKRLDLPMYDVCLPLGSHCRSTNIGKGSERGPAALRSSAPDVTYDLPSAFDAPAGRFISPNIMPRSSFCRLQERLSRSNSPGSSRSPRNRSRSEGRKGEEREDERQDEGRGGDGGGE